MTSATRLWLCATAGNIVAARATTTAMIARCTSRMRASGRADDRLKHAVIEYVAPRRRAVHRAPPPQRAACELHLPISRDHRFAVGAGLLQPVRGELVADFLEAGGELGARLKDLHALLRNLLVVPLGLVLPRLPAARLRRRGRLQERLLRRLVECFERSLVHEGDVLRDPRLRVVEVVERLPDLRVVAGGAR